MLGRITGRFADVRALKALFEAAEAAALRDGQTVPGPEHIVVGALSLHDGAAARVLADVDIEPTSVEAAIRQAHAATLGLEDDDGPVPTPPVARTTPYRVTPSGERFLRRIHDVHVAEGGRLNGAIVLVAAAGLDAGVWPRVLAAAGVTPEQLRAAAREELTRAT